MTHDPKAYEVLMDLIGLLSGGELPKPHREHEEPPPEACESMQRLVSAAPAAPDADLGAEDEFGPVSTRFGFDAVPEPPSSADHAGFEPPPESGPAGSPTEKPPASSRRPVLPAQAAPVLPDLRWDGPPEIAEPEAAPESGPQGLVHAEREPEVTGVRSFGSRPPTAPGQREMDVAIRRGLPPTFAAIVDDALSL